MGGRERQPERAFVFAIGVGEGFEMEIGKDASRLTDTLQLRAVTCNKIPLEYYTYV